MRVPFRVDPYQETEVCDVSRGSVVRITMVADKPATIEVFVLQKRSGYVYGVAEQAMQFFVSSKEVSVLFPIQAVGKLVIRSMSPATVHGYVEEESGVELPERTVEDLGVVPENEQPWG